MKQPYDMPMCPECGNAMVECSCPIEVERRREKRAQIEAEISKLKQRYEMDVLKGGAR